MLAHVGPAYRPIGPRPLIDALVRELPELSPVGAFGWKDRRSSASGLPFADRGAAWLPASALEEVAALVETSFPDSHAKPGTPGVERWAGVRDGDGRLTAVGALAWCAPTVGFLSGIAVHPRARKRGFGRRVSDFLVAEALRSYGIAALMVHDGDDAARRLYEGVGMRYRPVSSAVVGQDDGPPLRGRSRPLPC